MAKPNYDFAKRQRELQKAQKKEAKRLKKQGAVEAETPGGETPSPPRADEKPPAA